MATVESRADGKWGYQPHLDREPIVNIWDNKSGIFSTIKDAIKSGEIEIEDALHAANDLFKSTDPAQVKTGIHIYRLCMWREPSVAKEWIDIAPLLFNHSHSRIRHSTIWGLRTASWQDSQFSSSGLAFAQQGLKDEDLGVQRASMWALGDFVLNDPNLFSLAYNSLNQFLAESPKESNYLFAMERFFRSLKVSFGDDPRFRDTVSRMKKESNGYPGLRARTAALLNEKVSVSESQIDTELITEKYKRNINSTTLVRLPTDKSLIVAARSFQAARTFMEGINCLKLMKYLVWLSEDFSEPFEILAETLTDKRDGDLSRSVSVIMADCVIRKPDEMAETASQTVKNFFQQSDNDGSQIIVQLILDPVRHGSQSTQKVVENLMPVLHKYADNRSVSVALENH